MLKGIAPLFALSGDTPEPQLCSFSRSLRENEPKEGRYPQGPLQRGMQKIFRRNRRKILGFCIAGRRDEFLCGEAVLNNLCHALTPRGMGARSHQRDKQ